MKYCLTCGTVGAPTRRTQGSFFIELVLWFLFVVPGLVYSIWRLTSREWACPACGSPTMIPMDSPKARAALCR
jgi:hypothetical protein